jgi:leucyl-tRNA synthetase
VVVQINGKVRAEFETASGTTDEELKKLALERPETMKWIEGKEIKKIIVVKGKLVNIVV